MKNGSITMDPSNLRFTGDATPRIIQSGTALNPTPSMAVSEFQDLWRSVSRKSVTITAKPKKASIAAGRIKKKSPRACSKMARQSIYFTSVDVGLDAVAGLTK
jgi:hypothetical protein